jgi:hypothetical protein
VDQPPAVDNKVYKIISISLVIISQLMKELVVTVGQEFCKILCNERSSSQ